MSQELPVRGGTVRVAQVCPRYFPHQGGVETHVKELSRRLASGGLQVDVLTTDPTGSLPKTEVIDGVTVRRFFSIAPGDAYFFSPGLFDYLRQNSQDYELVHAHSYHSFPSLYAALSKGANKLVFTPHYHGVGHTRVRQFLHVPYRLVGKITFDRSDAIICVSRHERDKVLRAFEPAREKVTLIPNGIDLGELAALERVPSSPPRVLYVGRLERYKRIDCLIRSMEFVETGELDIVGVGPDRARLMRLADSDGLRGRVNFTGGLPRSELLHRFAGASVFVSLSEHEAFGITVAEALASGIPAVVSNESALSEFVDGVSCFGVDDPRDLELVGRTISAAMRTSTSRTTAKGWGEVAEATRELYETVLEEPERRLVEGVPLAK